MLDHQRDPYPWKQLFATNCWEASQNEGNEIFRDLRVKMTSSPKEFTLRPQGSYGTSFFSFLLGGLKKADTPRTVSSGLRYRLWDTGSSQGIPVTVMRWMGSRLGMPTIHLPSDLLREFLIKALLISWDRIISPWNEGPWASLWFSDEGLLLGFSGNGWSPLLKMMEAQV